MSGRTRYTCSYGLCTKDFLTPEGLKKHDKTHNYDGKYKCSHCNYTSDDRKSRSAHIIHHEGGRSFKCSFEGCEFTSNTLVYLKIHTQSIHSVYDAEVVDEVDNSLFKALLDAVEESSKESSIDDIQIVNHHISSIVPTAPTRYTCSFGFCHKYYPTAEGLVAHSKIHNYNGLYKCSLCNYRSDTKSNYDGHVEHHKFRGQPSFACPYDNCEFVTIKQGNLTAHLDIKHSVRDAEIVDGSEKSLVNRVNPVNHQVINNAPVKTTLSPQALVQVRNLQKELYYIAKKQPVPTVFSSPATITAPPTPKVVSAITAPPVLTVVSAITAPTIPVVPTAPTAPTAPIIKPKFPTNMACNPDAKFPDIAIVDINCFPSSVLIRCGECNFTCDGDGCLHAHYKRTKHHVNGVLPRYSLKCSANNCQYTSADLNVMVGHLLTHRQVFSSMQDHKKPSIDRMFINVVSREPAVPYDGPYTD